MSQKKDKEQKGPVRRYVLGVIVDRLEPGCFDFEVSKQQRVFFMPASICEHVSELPQDLAQGELGKSGKRVATVSFPDPKNISPSGAPRFFGWLF